MSAIAPSTDLYLIKCPLHLSNNDQVNFASRTAQANYFLSLDKLEAENYTYQRENSIIRFGANIDDIREYDYVMYKNENYSNKWFYAYITGMTYINDNVTAISIKTDNFQTWQFDLDFTLSNYIERAHVSVAEDIVGRHTIPEGLETGPYIKNGSSYSYNFSIANSYAICFQVSDMPDDPGTGSNPTIKQYITSLTVARTYNNIFSGTYFFSVYSALQAQYVIDAYNKAGLIDSIVSIFYAPISLVTGTATACSALVEGDTKTILIAQPATSTSVNDETTLNVARPTTLNGYTPHNAKLLTYPYCYLIGSNNGGETYDYHYEDFTSSSSNPIQFKIKSALCQGISSKMYPDSYKGATSLTDMTDFSITGAKFPSISWNSDYYLNWIAQNGMTMATSLATDIARSTLGAGLASQPAGLISAGLNIASSIANTVAEVEKQKILPDSAGGNTRAGDINFSAKTIGFNIKPMSIKSEYAAMIDNFFDMYGYKLNTTYRIDSYMTSRPKWNYIKTIGCYLGGDVPQDAIADVESMFNEGLTIWHDTSNFRNYLANNRS